MLACALQTEHEHEHGLCVEPPLPKETLNPDSLFKGEESENDDVPHEAVHTVINAGAIDHSCWTAQHSWVIPSNHQGVKKITLGSKWFDGT